MSKNGMRVLLSFCILVIVAVSAFFLLNYKRNGNLLAIKQWLRPESVQKPNLHNAPNLKNAIAKRVTENEYIHGQIIYDARTNLPPQAILDIKLMEITSAQLATTIAKVQLPLTDHSPQNWALPVKLSNLSKNKSYTIQAKISSGDTLLFVTAAPTELDYHHAAYIIHLAKIDSGIPETETYNLIGTSWRAVALFNKKIEKNSEISLNIDEEAKTDPTSTTKSYRARGSGGCNRYMTAVTINDKNKNLSFTPLAAGLIACNPAINNQEADFIAMMGKVQAYKIDESGVLYLLDEKRNPLARFVAY